MKKTEELRPVTFIKKFTKYAPGSVLVSYGNTKVLCTATIEEKVPSFLKGRGQGWLTAEYSLLPSSTVSRTNREISKGKLSGRTSEIQRLIGRSLRSILDLKALGERTIYIDADVLQADGGTRTAAISGGMAALVSAVQYLQENKKITKNPIRELLAAVSVGVFNQEVILDLDYKHDLNADVDMNIVMTESGKFVEIQGTAEKNTFSHEQLLAMLALAKKGINQIIVKIKDGF
ncbi:ribonuclease PH [bacterium]|jgi:ribonuclease PH|nr:ribonuclease PH [bacterium]MBT4552416.1 ribonuclease PH [bacterium]MBT5989086.1 ribonuclease PH [bacterium]MBT7088045.1 ribonuclease PH [bacterium]